MRLTPASELHTRIARFQARLQSAALDGALLSQNADLLYFSGTMQTSQLFIPDTGTPLLMTRKSYPRARQESALQDIIHVQGLRDLPGVLAAHGFAGARRLGLELDVLPASTYLGLSNLLPDVQWADVSAIVRETRAIKSAYEIAILREAAVLMDRVFAAAPTLLRPGITEVEFAGMLEAIARREGHPGVIRMRYLNQENFYGHVLSGENGAVPSYLDSPTGGQGLGPAMPQGASRKPIHPGEPVLVDLVAVVDGLMVDQTRIFALGSLPADLLAAQAAMLQVQKSVIEAARPGAICGELYELALRAAADLGYAANFMGFNDDRVNFVGHGVGLELNEMPVLARNVKTPLLPGHVFALEPKCLFPGLGAVGIENTWLVTEAGVERLTLTPDDVVVL